MKGLLIFINMGLPSQGPAVNPIFAGISRGNCSSCHGGPELTNAGITNQELIEIEETPELVDGLLEAGEETAFVDGGFANIGVTPTANDLGRGGTENGLPLSFSRQALQGLAFAPDLPECGGPDEPVCPVNNRVQVDGAFKIPGLRNVELTGPYFHNGGKATLTQVVEFYERQGDFGDLNILNLDDDMALVNLADGDEGPLVKFLLALTDERVRNEMAPFDHPQIFVHNGHPGDQHAITCVVGIQACDDIVEIPMVGRDGRQAAGLPPLDTFLGLSPLDN